MSAGKDKECNFLEEYCVAPAPSRDYYGIKVTETQVIIYLWRVARRTSGLPTVRRETLADFVRNPSIQNEVNRIFGGDTADQIMAIARGERSYLPHLPQDVLTRIFLHLELRDIARLAQVCSKLRQATENSALWQKLFRKYNRGPLTVDQTRRATLMGWKRFFRTSFQHQIKSTPSPPLLSISGHRQLNQRTQSSTSARSSRSTLAESSNSIIATPTKNYRIQRESSKMRERSPFLASKFKEIADRGKKLSVQVLYTASAMANKMTGGQPITATPSQATQGEKELGAYSLRSAGSAEVAVEEKTERSLVSSDESKTSCVTAKSRRPNTAQVYTSATQLSEKSSSLMRFKSATIKRPSQVSDKRRTSGEQSASQSLDKATRKTSETDKAVRKTPENEKTVKKMSENEKTVRKMSENEKTVRKMSENEKTVRKTPENEKTVKKMSENEKAARNTSAKQSKVAVLRNTSDEHQAALSNEKAVRMTLEKQSKVAVLRKTSDEHTAALSNEKAVRMTSEKQSKPTPRNKTANSLSAPKKHTKK